MADFGDAAAGWEIFRPRGGEIGRQQLNIALENLGHNPVSPRTYRHYQKLLRMGFREYVSINRLDIRYANDSVFDVSDRSRYLEVELSSPARLVIPQASSVVSIDGFVRRISEGFAVMRVAVSDDALRTARAQKHNRGVLVFLQAGIERAVRVIESEPTSDGALDLVLEFRSLLETDLLVPETLYASTGATFALDLGPSTSLFTMLSSMHAAFDLLESVRAFVQVASSREGKTAVVPPYRVRSVDYSNPLVFLLGGPVLVFGGVLWIINRVTGSVSKGADVTSKVQAIRHESSAERRRDEIHDLNVRSMKLDNLKKGIEVGQMLDALEPGLREIVGSELAAISPSGQARLEALKDQAVDAAAELELSSREPLQFEIGDEASSESADTDRSTGSNS